MGVKNFQSPRQYYWKSDSFWKVSPIDVTLFDVAKCFDKIWLEDSLIDLFEAGLNNDNLVLPHKANVKNSVAVKTAFGKTDRFDITNNILQGTKFGPLMCTTSMSKLGDLEYKQSKQILTYKDTVKVPSLGMIDDILNVGKCGRDAVCDNNRINSFVESKRLNFSEKKCNRLHIGKNN